MKQINFEFSCFMMRLICDKGLEKGARVRAVRHRLGLFSFNSSAFRDGNLTFGLLGVRGLREPKLLRCLSIKRRAGPSSVALTLEANLREHSDWSILSAPGHKFTNINVFASP